MKGGEIFLDLAHHCPQPVGDNSNKEKNMKKFAILASLIMAAMLLIGTVPAMAWEQQDNPEPFLDLHQIMVRSHGSAQVMSLLTGPNTTTEAWQVGVENVSTVQSLRTVTCKAYSHTGQLAVGNRVFVQSIDLNAWNAVFVAHQLGFRNTSSSQVISAYVRGPF